MGDGIDHNQYIIDNAAADQDEYRGFTFQSNYEHGLRVLSTDDIADGVIREVAYFDTLVDSHFDFQGSWSVFPYYPLHRDEDGYSGLVVSQNTNTGMFVLQMDADTLNDIYSDVSVSDDSDSGSGSDEGSSSDDAAAYSIAAAVVGDDVDSLSSWTKETGGDNDGNTVGTIKISLSKSLNANLWGMVSVILSVFLIVICFKYDTNRKQMLSKENSNYL